MAEAGTPAGRSLWAGALAFLWVLLSPVRSLRVIPHHAE